MSRRDNCVTAIFAAGHGPRWLADTGVETFPPPLGILYFCWTGGSKVYMDSNRSERWCARHYCDVRVCVEGGGVDYCIHFTRKNQRFSTWRWLRAMSTPRFENARNVLMTARHMSWACELAAEMLLILISLFSTWLIQAKVSDMTAQRNDPRFCMSAICGWNLQFQILIQLHWDTFSPAHFPANTRHWANVGLMLGQRRRRWTNIKPILVQCLVFAGLVQWQKEGDGRIYETTRIKYFRKMKPYCKYFKLALNKSYAI